MRKEWDAMRVAIASDQAIFRRGLVSLVTSLQNLQLVGEAHDGQETLQLCELAVPDLLLLDLKATAADLHGIIEQLGRRWPHLQLIQFVDDLHGQEASGWDASRRLLCRSATEAEFITVMTQIPLAGSTQEDAGEATPVSLQTQALQHLEQEIRSPALSHEELPAFLAQCLPRIFPAADIHLRFFPNQDLFSTASGPSQFIESAFRWLRTTTEASVFSPGDAYPWGGRQTSTKCLILAPVLKGHQTIGGIYLSIPVERLELPSTLANLHTLAGHLSLALERLQSAARQSSGEAAVKELEMAGKIQSDILPERAPAITGYDIAARLESARETSGDFYDFIPLPNGSWGIVIADVTDKGMGAALFMALSSTLIRTYAARYPTLPAFTLDVVNERILSDSRGNMFVTVFYLVLEPQLGRLRIVNAGHPPAYLFSIQKGKPVDGLRPTGMALGVMEGAHWQQKVAKMNPGDMLVLYTDGVTEAQNAQGVFFGEQRLLDVVRSKAGRTAREVVEAVLHAVRAFAGESIRQDDIALIVLRRKI